MPVNLSHSEFLNHIRREREYGAPTWGVTDFSKAIVTAWGAGGVMRLFIGTLVVLTPIAIVGILIFRSRQFTAFGFLGVAFWSGLTARSNLSGIGLIFWALFGAIGALLGFSIHPIYLTAGWVPVMTYILGGAVRGTLMVGLEGRISTSEDVYLKLSAKDLLIVL
jgi:hypothetical protein